MKRRFKVSTFFQLLAALVVVLLAIYLTAVTVMGTRWFHDLLERQAVHQLEASTGARVEMRSLQVQPLIFQVTVRGLTLHGSEPASQPPLFTAKIIVIRVNPLSLIRGKLLISRFDGEGIDIHLMTHVSGSTNIPGPHGVEGAAVTNLLNLSIRTLVLHNACLYWKNQKIPLDLTARKIAILLNHGLGHNYNGSFSSSPLCLRPRGIALPPLVLSTRVEFSHNVLTLSHLTWRSAIGSGGGHVNLQWNPQMHGLASLEAQGKLLTLAEALRWKVVQSGSFKIRCEAAYLNGALSVLGRIQTDKVLLHQTSFAPGPVDFTSDFSGNESHVSLMHMKIHAMGGSFDGAGSVQFRAGTPEFNLRGQAQGLSLSQALRAVPRSEMVEELLPLAATISGKMQASWRGRFKGLRSAFDLTATPPIRVLKGQHPVIGTASGSLELEPALLISLEQVQLATPHSSLQAQGTLGGAASNLTIHYSTTDFQETERLMDTVAGLSKPIPLTLQSTATFVGAVTGSISDPKIQGRISVGPFSYQGWAWQAFNGNATASPEGVAVSDGHLRSGPSILNFNGSVALTSWKVTAQSQLRLMARALRSPLRGLESAFGFHFPLSGLATGELKIGGAPSNLGGTGKFQVLDGAVEGEPFHELSGRVLIAGSAWDFQDVTLTKGTGELAGWVRVDWPSRSFSMDFHGGNLSLANFERLQPPVPQSAGEYAPKPFQGVISGHVQGSGSLSDPQIHSTLSIQHLTVKEKATGDLHAQLLLDGNQLSGKGSLHGPDGDFDFTAIVKTEGDWPLQLKGTFSSFRLDPWLSLEGRNKIGAPIISSGSVVAAGPLKNPAKLTGHAKADKLAILIPGFTVENSQPVEFRYSNGAIDSNRFEMQGPSTKLQIHLSARLTPRAEISLDARGSAQASLLRLFDPSVEAVGRFVLNVHATGSATLPSLSGEVQVKDVSLRYSGLALPLSGLNGTILLQGNRATLQSFKEENGQTSIQLSGYATIGANPGFNLQAKFQHVRLEYPAGFTSILSGGLKLTGSAQSAELNGQVFVDGMFVGENFNVVDWVGQMGTAMETPSTSASPAAASKVRLDVHVLTNPMVRLDSRTLSYVAAIDVYVRGTVARPVMTGDIHIRKGQALVAGARYQINRGDITMTSAVQTAPVVDIEASTRVERYNLTIEITGPADRARISYRSDPPLPTEQILSLLALGYVPQQALMSSSGAQHMGAIGAGSLLTQALSNQVSGRFQRLFGASRIRVNPNLLGPSTAGGARVTIEEQVSRDLTITYSTNTAAAQQRDIRLRWDVSNKISLIGERDINGVYGFEVRFRRSLK